ncbi:MAG: hypothetical protein JNL80_17960 [Phycisphaerae bacterium]|jgi:hypothetical protein|nr:hypothetical protein [Phycisphaerae bacterium]
MNTTSFTLRTRVTLGCAGAVAVLLAGCSNGTIKGRVLRGDSSFIQWVNSSSSAGGGEPIGGAAISVTRDPLSPGREVVGNGVSQADGSFSIKLDAFGAGWTDEDWLIVAERRGAGRAEYIGRLQGGQSLLILLAPGTDRGPGTNDLWNGNIGSMPSGSSVVDEAKRYR